MHVLAAAHEDELVVIGLALPSTSTPSDAALSPAELLHHGAQAPARAAIPAVALAVRGLPMVLLAVVRVAAHQSVSFATVVLVVACEARPVARAARLVAHEVVVLAQTTRLSKPDLQAATLAPGSTPNVGPKNHSATRRIHALTTPSAAT